MIGIFRNTTSIAYKTSVTYFNRQSSSTLIKLKKIQADFQCEDGKPIWLKGGLCDHILYGTTVALCYVGTFMVLGTIYDNAKPASWKTST